MLMLRFRCKLVSVGRFLSSIPSMEAIQILRYRTEAGILDCRRALKDCNGDIERAIQWLQKNGVAKAVKKQGHKTNHGVVVVCACPNAPRASVLEVCTESDFGARSDRFHSFVKHAKSAACDVLSSVTNEFYCELLDRESIDGSRNVLLERICSALESNRNGAVAALGENITIDSMWCFPPLPQELHHPCGEEFAVGKYIHNHTEVDSDIGNHVCIALLQSRSGGSVCASAANDMAQHLVANYGSSGPIAQQPFLGSKETAGQWLKRHSFVLRGATVVKYGEQPVFHCSK